MMGIIGIVVLLSILLFRMPVAFAFALVGFVGFAYMVKLSAAFSLLATDFFEVFSSYHLTVIPLFILMGQLAHQSGISRKLYVAALAVFGRTRGGLAIATIAASAAFGACCGSSPASAATMCSVALPEMRRLGYNDSLATGSIAAGGGLAVLIPPSVIMIIYGIMTGQSIAKLFVAGILPGIVLTVLYIIAIIIITRIDPSLGPGGQKTKLKQKVLAVMNGIGDTALLFFLIMGGLVIGFFTPSEAGAIGALGVLLIGLTRRTLGWENILLALSDTVRLSSMIFLIIAGATVFGHFLAATQLPLFLASWVAGLPFPRIYIMIAMILVYIIGGCVMDGMALLLLSIPIFFPVTQSLGYDPIWFGIIVVVVMEIAVITPPIGLNVFVVKGIAKDVPIGTIFRGVFPFFLADLVLLVILMLVPQLALLLPKLLTY